MPELLEQVPPKPRKGGKMIPHPPELIEQARVEYLAGKPIAEIAKLTGLAEGTIRGKASLSGWVQVKRESNRTEALEAQSTKVRANLAQELVEQAESLRSIPAKPGINNLLLRSQIATPIVQNCKTVFAWQEQSGNTLINVAVLSQCGEPVSTVLPSDTIDTIEVAPVLELPCPGEE